MEDSWETADLDERVSRLLLTSRRASSSPELVEDASTAATPPPPPPRREDPVAQVDQFLREAVEKPRERLSVLRMEQDIEKFIRDPRQTQLEFQGLPTSYLRLAAHRLAQHYFLQSVAVPDNSFPDGSGSRIILQKTSLQCRFPTVRLADIPVNLPQEDSTPVAKVAIKQRPRKQFGNVGDSNGRSSGANPQKSVEERKEEYNKARARIFSNNNSCSSAADRKLVDEVTLPNTLHRCSSLELNSSNRLSSDGPEITLERSLTTSSAGHIPNRSKNEKEPATSRHRQSNRVAIFRDHEVDRKDPDYDRSYDRYMQRFDPGFGFNGSSYTIQPLYAPVVKYNTEFPQLGSGHRSPVPVEQQPRPMAQHMPGSWAAQVPSTVGYRPPESLMATYNHGHVGAPVRSPVLMHTSQQYPMPSHPGVSFVHPHEPTQPSAQTHQQRPEVSFSLSQQQRPESSFPRPR